MALAFDLQILSDVPFRPERKVSVHYIVTEKTYYFFSRYQPPVPAKDLLAEFWEPEKEAEMVLKRLAQ